MTRSINIIKKAPCRAVSNLQRHIHCRNVARRHLPSKRVRNRKLEVDSIDYTNEAAAEILVATSISSMSCWSGAWREATELDAKALGVGVWPRAHCLQHVQCKESRHGLSSQSVRPASTWVHMVYQPHGNATIVLLGILRRHVELVRPQREQQG